MLSLFFLALLGISGYFLSAFFLLRRAAPNALFDSWVACVTVLLDLRFSGQMGHGSWVILKAPVFFLLRAAGLVCH